jgi:hypothetical protein
VPSAAEREQERRRAPAITWSAGPSFALLPGAGGTLGGTYASLGFRAFGASERAFGRWLTGSSGGNMLRWCEAGLAVDYRVWLHPSVRLSFGADASLAFLRFSNAFTADGSSGARDALTGRAAGLLGLEVRAFGQTWASLTLSPGALLRGTPYEDATGRRGAVEGLWLGIDLGLYIERPIPGSISTNR